MKTTPINSQYIEGLTDTLKLSDIHYLLFIDLTVHQYRGFFRIHSTKFCRRHMEIMVSFVMISTFITITRVGT